MLISACGGSGAGPPAPVANAQSSSSSSSSSAATTFTVGGTVTGLAGSVLIVSDNVGDSASVTANGTFVFASGYASGKTYSVTVTGQPASQLCAVVAGASGTIGSTNVTDVEVDCRADPTFKISEYPVPNLVAGFANVSDGTLWGLSAQQSMGTWTNSLDQIAPDGTVTSLDVQGALSTTAQPLGTPFGGPNGLDVWVASAPSSASGSATFNSLSVSGAAAGTATACSTAGPDIPCSSSSAESASIELFDGCGDLWYATNQGYAGADTTIATIPTGFTGVGTPNCPPGAGPTSVTLPGADVAAMALGPDGRIWFTSESSSVIGVITPAWLYTAQPGQPPPETTITTWPLPAHSDDVSPSGAQTGSMPAGIALGSDGNLWFVERAQPTMRIGCFSPPSFNFNVPSASTPAPQFAEFTVPSSAGYVLGPNIATGPDGNLWFTVWSEQVGNIAPGCAANSSPQINVSTVPTADAFPTAPTAGPDGRVWFIEPAGAAESGQAGAISVTTPVAPNDDFANAATLSGAATPTGTAGFVSTNDYSATAEAGEPPIVSGTTPMRTLWWRWTAPSSGTLVLNTFGSSYETVTGVFAYAPGGNLTAFSGLAPCGTGSAVPCPVAYDHQPGPGLSNLTLTVTAGTTYAIVVDGNNGAKGLLLIEWQFTSS